MLHPSGPVIRRGRLAYRIEALSGCQDFDGRYDSYQGQRTDMYSGPWRGLIPHAGPQRAGSARRPRAYPCQPGRWPNTGASPLRAAATGHRSRAVTPACRQALFPLLRATDGPGWEDPGAVYVRGMNGRGSMAPTTRGVHQNFLFPDSATVVATCLGWSVGHGPPWRHRPTTTRASHRPQGPSSPRQPGHGHGPGGENRHLRGPGPPSWRCNGGPSRQRVVWHLPGDMNALGRYHGRGRSPVCW
jgi:hypothetical protein